MKIIACTYEPCKTVDFHMALSTFSVLVNPLQPHLPVPFPSSYCPTPHLKHEFLSLEIRLRKNFQER